VAIADTSNPNTSVCKIFFNKTYWQMYWNSIFSLPKRWKWTLWNTQETST